MKKDVLKSETDVLLIGAGIMSATLGIMLKELNPALSITVLERMDSAATESSDAWNNAGTGHSAFCELNYTPQQADGSINISKALNIACSFEESKQFWAYLVKNNLIALPDTFIQQVPHMSFVKGEKDVAFLKKRYESLKSSPLFKDMLYSEDHEQLEAWMPLMMKGRDKNEKIAATYMAIGTDVNFGSLTRNIFNKLQSFEDVSLTFNQEVTNIRRSDKGSWRVSTRDVASGKKQYVKAKFVFIGAGGGALPLLLKSGIKESKGYGGFPVSGQWLRCNNPEVIAQHGAKVYGLASVGAPPMSVPHLDTRMINGKKELLYGPFAGFTTKFLKEGSVLDLIKSIRLNNIWPMLAAGYHNLDLTKYLIDQVKLSQKERVDILKDFIPTAEYKDWELEIAGQRVQIIKKDEKKGGKLEFGTEIVSSADGSISALLGASPGASTAVSIMVNLLEKCFTSEFKSEQWQTKLKEMIPSYQRPLKDDEGLLAEMRNYTAEALKL